MNRGLRLACLYITFFAQCTLGKNSRDNDGNHAPDSFFFFNTQLPRLELTARAHSLRIHVLRSVPKHPLPSPPRALCSRSAFTGIPLQLLIARWSVGQRFSSLFSRPGDYNWFTMLTSNYSGPYSTCCLVPEKGITIVFLEF